MRNAKNPKKHLNLKQKQQQPRNTITYLRASDSILVTIATISSHCTVPVLLKAMENEPVSIKVALDERDLGLLHFLKSLR